MQGEDQELVAAKRMCSVSVSRTSLGKIATAVGDEIVLRAAGGTG